ncbi:MAG: hypothetical protein ABWK00_04490 [Desulfurococcaceae archaeon]
MSATAGITVELMDERTIGRNFQLAALGALPAADPAAQRLVNSVLREIPLGRFALGGSECTDLLSYLQKLLDLACQGRGKRYPKLYTAGSPKDAEVLRSAKIISASLSCEDLRSSLGKLSCDDLAKATRVPMFLRHYVFSLYRSGEDVSKTSTTSVASLLLATLGALTSHVATYVAEERRREIYIVPDGTPSSIRASESLYALIYSSKVGRRFDEVLNDLMELGGVSPEIAMDVALMIHASQELGLTERLLSARAFEGFLLVAVESEQRPLTTYISPITAGAKFERLRGPRAASGLLLELDRLVRSARRTRDRELAGTASDVASGCVNAIYRFAETGDASALLECSADLARLHDAASRKGDAQLADASRSLLGRISLMAGGPAP